MSVPLYSKMSVTSKNEIRYEGILLEINAAGSTITLAQVRALGTEGRRPAGEIAASPNVFEKIIFRGSDIKELKVLAPPPAVQPSAQLQPQSAQYPVQHPVTTLPAYQPQPSVTPAQQPQAPVQVLPRVAEVSRMSRLFSEDPSKKNPTNTPELPSAPSQQNATAKPSTTVTESLRPKSAWGDVKEPAVSKPDEKKKQPEVVQSAIKPTARTSLETQQQPKKSVFDTNADKQTAVVTVEGLGADTNPGQVRQLFDEQNAIVSVKLMSLPSGSTAADIVFSDLDSATRAVQSFSHPGMTARHMESGTQPPRARTDQRTFGGGEKGERDTGKAAPPQVRNARQPPTVTDRNGFGGNQRGQSYQPRRNDARRDASGAPPPLRLGEDGISKKKSDDATAPEGSDFDFSASNARFEKEDFAAQAPAPKAKSFFDDVSMSQNVDARALDNRKKNAETFGSIAYAHRGGSGGYRGGRGGGRGRGGGGRGGGPPTFRDRMAHDGKPNVVKAAATDS